MGCEKLLDINPKSGHVKDSEFQIKWKRIQEKLGQNMSIKHLDGFDYSLLEEKELKIINDCLSDAKKQFVAMPGKNMTDEYIKEYCIKHAWTEYSGTLLSNQMKDILANYNKFKEFESDNTFFYDHHKLLHGFSDRCAIKHHVGRVHSAGYYPLKLMIYLNIF